MRIGEILALCAQVAAIVGGLVSCIIYLLKIIRGQKCLLRSQMLAIYYANREAQCLTQYQYENFVLLYEAYKNLKGNSFIDKVYGEIKEWRVEG